MKLKIQRPLAGDMSAVLVYDQTRRHEWFQPYDDDMKAFMGEAKKRYVEGHVVDGKLIVEHELVGESW